MITPQEFVAVLDWPIWVASYASVVLWIWAVAGICVSWTLLHRPSLEALHLARYLSVAFGLAWTGLWAVLKVLEHGARRAESLPWVESFSARAHALFIVAVICMAIPVAIYAYTAFEKRMTRNRYMKRSASLAEGASR